MSELTLTATIWATLCTETAPAKQFKESFELWQVPQSVAFECMGAPGKELAIYTRYFTQGKVTTNITAEHLDDLRGWINEKREEGWTIEWGMA